MAEILKLYKEIGETPLECILRFKAENPSYVDTKMAYLGRLDPMAEGLLLVLVGPGPKEKYFALDKTYEFEVLWGFETDTYDVLGLITNLSYSVDVSEARLLRVAKKISKYRTQKYPPFSSKVFKKDFLLARDNKLKDLDTPKRGIKIFSFEHIHTRLALGREILDDITKRISMVKGDFRQSEILRAWNESLGGRLDEKFMVSKFVADVSTGTYIRGLAHEMGQELGLGAIAYNIKRTRVGEYEVE